MKYCSNCGKPVDEDSKFCQNCGAPIASEPAGKKGPDFSAIAKKTGEKVRETGEKVKDVVEKKALLVSGILAAAVLALLVVVIVLIATRPSRDDLESGVSVSSQTGDIEEGKDANDGADMSAPGHEGTETAEPADEPEPAGEPEPTERPLRIYAENGDELGPYPEVKTLNFSNGYSVQAYAVDLFDYIDYDDFDKIGRMSYDKITFGSTTTKYFGFTSYAKNCYGISVEYEVENLENYPDGVSLRLGMRMDEKWSYGDYHTESNLEMGGKDTFTVYNKDRGRLNGVIVVTSKPMKKIRKFEGHMNSKMILYFDSFESAQTFIRTLVTQ